MKNGYMIVILSKDTKLLFCPFCQECVSKVRAKLKKKSGKKLTKRVF